MIAWVPWLFLLLLLIRPTSVSSASRSWARTSCSTWPTTASRSRSTTAPPRPPRSSSPTTRRACSAAAAVGSSRRAKLEDFVQSIKRPRRIIILVKAGGPTDAVIDSLVPHLEKGDVVVDGGNALYTDTIRREKALERQGPAVRRLRRHRRRGRRALRTVADAGRQARVVGDPEAGVDGDRGEGRREDRQAHRGRRARQAGHGRRAVHDVHRARRRRSLRQDGAQRHRVRRHAADLRGLLDPAPRARQVAPPRSRRS